VGVRYLRGDFQFPPSFGFSGSAQGRHDPRPHPVQGNDEYGPQGLADGGQPDIPEPKKPKAPKEPMVPMSTAVHAARGAAILGARAARSRGALQPPPGRAAGGQPPRAAAPPPPAPVPPGLPGPTMRGAPPTQPGAMRPPAPLAPSQAPGMGLSKGGRSNRRSKGK
jgi:hypothetical protein